MKQLKTPALLSLALLQLVREYKKNLDVITLNNLHQCLTYFHNKKGKAESDCDVEVRREVNETADNESLSGCTTLNEAH